MFQTKLTKRRFCFIRARRAQLGSGADVAQANQDGMTALLAASYGGDLECVRALLEADADVAQAQADGTTALMAASDRGHLECVRALLRAGADFAQALPDGTTALMVASGEGHLECVRALLDAGADVAQVNQSGSTALMAASGAGRFQCLRALLQAGADPAQLGRKELAAVVQFYLRAAEQGDADAPGALAELAGRREIAAACCTACGARHKLKTCARCKVARFCDADCTARAWPVHRPNCKAWLAQSASADE